ncbi:hypothetical protein Naga_100049g3 [Nannochloropsis gaditana]|uniref:Uncharacterized protein n=1 Tax=Nannochloropsis gaditana TaxID=72520 RepID=W7TDK8_9STRA|nr:hypothetical protein Naga_100049g3 [Nannochloropsis gaditana]
MAPIVVRRRHFSTCTLVVCALFASGTAFVFPVAPSSSRPVSHTKMAASKSPLSFGNVVKFWVGCSLLLTGHPSLANAVPDSAHVVTTSTILGSSSVPSSKGVEVLNDFLRAVKAVKAEITSDKPTDLKYVQKAFDVEAVTTAVDGTLDAQMTGAAMDQVSIVGKRKVIDKVLRQVLSDVITVEDILRDMDPAKTGLSRFKKVGKPLGKLENDLQRLTSALTSNGADDTAGAAGLEKPLFSLCPDGYLLCNPE